MRITKIKLSGFKSFVDPTTLTLPGNLTGVVGPNGCGKSNIIDALMWVMGESSAKQLRGDSMADVIFNGSNSRKPVGQASVELVFDNSDGTLGGQYAGFGEIAIKRSITRDGVSTYQLNGTRCRRKDVTNVFLGTGLGSRGGYSVIEQGMISRVVEAKPEELRGFLEEAAGISKYKERRRETENRIRHTKENIERLDDIREEITKQLSHLKRQANAAERYQVLKREERVTDAELLALRWRGIDESRAQQAHILAEIETKVEASIAALRNIEADQTAKREEQTQATDAFNKVQSDFYASSAEISRLEQAIQHAEERKTSIEHDLRRAQQGLEDLARLLESDTDAIGEIDRQIERLDPDAMRHSEAAEHASEALKQSEETAEKWQHEWDDFNRERSETVRLEHAEQMRLEHLQEGITGAQARIEGLNSEQLGTSTLALEAKVSQLGSELLRNEQGHDELLLKRDSVKAELQDVRSRTYRHGDELHELRTELESLRGRESSLKELQDAALRQDQDALRGWLHELSVDDGDRLGEQIEIERGWEAAVEMAIRVPLNAVCQEQGIEQILAADITRLPSVLATFIDGSAPTRQEAPASGTDLLANKVRSKWSTATLLAGVYTAESLADARLKVTHLAAHESVITRDGHWLGPNWAQIRGGGGAESGILERERALDEVRASSQALESSIRETQAEFDSAQEMVSELEERELDVDNALQEVAARTTELKTDLARQDATLERVRERTATIRDELQALEQQSVGSESAAATALASLQEIRARLGDFETRHEGLVASRSSMQAELDSARTAWRDARESHHEAALKLEGLRSSKESLKLALQRNQQQRDDLTARCADLEAAMVSAGEPQHDLQQRLEQGLAARLGAETALAESRKTLEAFDEAIKQNDEAKLKAERAVEAERAVLDQARLDERSIQVRLQELEERIAQTEFSIDALLKEIADEATEELWQERLERTRKRIDRLGPINLAAIDEFAQLSERKEYLDQQNNDLTNALDTLEGAIRKIDRETRTRFKETFDKVNSQLQELFPVLFGGGHAYLELTGEDLLETGVTVMARPPGKRNSNIHLLSGGEKALTALAFVFSLFELNPAPFCLLDEVDAPLDDANVVRLSKMLQTMSQRVQFLCVTHNKITMEITEQLVGVTMQEAGVSRLVSVNMDEAVEMAAAS